MRIIRISSEELTALHDPDKIIYYVRYQDADILRNLVSDVDALLQHFLSGHESL